MFSFSNSRVRGILCAATFAAANSASATEIDMLCERGLASLDLGETPSFSFREHGSQVGRVGRITWSFDGQEVAWVGNQGAFSLNLQTGTMMMPNGPAQSCDIPTNIESLIPILGDIALRVAFEGLEQYEREIVQQNLGGLAYYDGAVDGIWGSRTLLAVRQFSTNHTNYENIASITLEDANAIIELALTYVFEGDDLAYHELDGMVAMELSNVTNSFQDMCLQTVDAVNYAVASLGFAAANDYSNLWNAVGISAYDVSAEATTSNLNRRGNPQDFTAAPNVARAICADYQWMYDEYVNRVVAIETDELVITRVVYQADDLERERIPGTWAMPYSLSSDQYLRSALQTNFVSFNYVQNLARQTEQCEVEFYIMPLTHPIQAVREATNISSVAAMYQYAIWGLPMVTIAPTDQGAARSRLVYLRDMTIGNREIVAAIDNRYSVFNGGVDWALVEDDLQALNDRSGMVALFDVVDVVPRSINTFVNNPICQGALNEARERYARAAFQ